MAGSGPSPGLLPIDSTKPSARPPANALMNRVENRANERTRGIPRFQKSRERSHGGFPRFRNRANEPTRGSLGSKNRANEPTRGTPNAKKRERSHRGGWLGLWLRASGQLRMHVRSPRFGEPDSSPVEASLLSHLSNGPDHLHYRKDRNLGLLNSSLTSSRRA